MKLSKKIVLIGFMGSGKSTIGKKLSLENSLKYVDLDDLIVNSTNLSIKEIFNQYGEYHFRKIERKYLIEALNSNRDIISVGGGTPCFYNNLQLINASSISIYLKTNVTILFERLIKSKYQRPTIEHMDEDALQNFIVTSLEKRKPYYNKAHFIVENTEIEATIHQLNEIMAFK